MVVDSDTYHEDIGALVLGLTIDIKVFIATRVMYLNIYLVSLDVLRASVDVQHGRLIVLRELVMEVVVNQTRFPDSSVAHEDQLNLLSTIIFN